MLDEGIVRPVRVQADSLEGGFRAADVAQDGEHRAAELIDCRGQTFHSTVQDH